MNEKRSILYCHCAYSQVVPGEVKDEVFRRLSASGRAFRAVADLCELAARRDEGLTELFRAGEVTVIACFPRAVKWLLAAAGVDVQAARVRFLNVRAQPADEIIRAALGEAAGAAAASPRADPPSADGEWTPWFPVIDRNRCTSCGKCHAFCLFGVYEREGDAVRVARPERCKTHCPACARLCPASAIIFPKFPFPPINGDEVRLEDLQARKMPADLPALVRQDLHAALRARSGGQAAAVDVSELQKAIERRRPCACTPKSSGPSVGKAARPQDDQAGPK